MVAWLSASDRHARKSVRLGFTRQPPSNVGRPARRAAGDAQLVFHEKEIPRCRRRATCVQYLDRSHSGRVSNCLPEAKQLGRLYCAECRSYSNTTLGLSQAIIERSLRPTTSMGAGVLARMARTGRPAMFSRSSPAKVPSCTS